MIDTSLHLSSTSLFLMPPRSAISLSFGLLCGLTSTAASQTQTRQPVISKVEIIFSMVSHYNHIADRINFYNAYGSPKGNTNYAVPHLVYEPTVTLYNPYNEPLTMTRSRVKIWDPPVGFTFKKNDVYLRSDFASGNFHSAGRFQIANQFNSNVRKSFTLSLSSPTATGAPGDPIVLQPGESRTFSTWVDKDWDWALETTDGFFPRSFYDWNDYNNFTNRDARTSNNFGVEAISHTIPFSNLDDPRAGFQTDSLSLGDGQRPTASLYSFESSMNYNAWVAIKLDDTVSVQAKPVLTSPFPSLSYFVVEQLKGENQDASADIARQFRMDQADIVQNNNPIISRTFRVGDILQSPTDKTVGGKSPFAKFTMVAKSSALRTNRFYANPAIPGNELYELQFGPLTDFNTTPPSAPSDASLSAPLEIHGVSRSGNTVFIDFSGSALPLGTGSWKVRGTSSLEAGFNDNLDSATTVIKSMSNSGIYKAIIDISGRGERYFVRIEE